MDGEEEEEEEEEEDEEEGKLIRKKPSMAKKPSAPMKKPAAVVVVDPSVDEVEDVRNRVKVKKIKDLFTTLPDVVQKAWKDLLIIITIHG